MSSKGIDTKDVDALLTSIATSDVEVHIILQSGKLAISGRVCIQENVLGMDISSIPPQFIESLSMQTEAIAIVFLNGEKISWRASIVEIIKPPDAEEIIKPTLLITKPKNITRLAGRKNPRETISPQAIKIKIRGSEETFDLIDISPGGCAFSAPSHSAKLWAIGSILDFEATSSYAKISEKLIVVRVSFDMQSDAEHETIVSCRFENEKFGQTLQSLGFTSISSS